jgi:pimeloyl-ACP methyl ester carboxylesterase
MPEPSSPRTAAALRLPSFVPGARLETIPAGHLIHATDPAAFTKTALTFLLVLTQKP